MVPKFRAWDKEENLWIKVASLVFDEEGEMWYLGPVMDDFNPVYYENELGKTWEIMQSTGLKDKNDVEIFEGDIVSVRNHPFQKTEKSGAGIEIDGDYAISWNEGDLTWCAGNLLLARLNPYVTVSGNIYENPELLNQSNES
ncbi:YopX family protein [Enterococcus casseliflavus]|uniref:YopX family protein n=1 Tax=Enterococcus casseliflavus TaxID=37734 RepID=UPI0035D891E4